MEGWLRFVKIFVVVAGVALVAGTALLVFLLFQRPGGRGVDLARPVTVQLPAGMRLVRASGSAEGVVLELVDGQARSHLLVIDPASGRARAFLRLDETP